LVQDQLARMNRRRAIGVAVLIVAIALVVVCVRAVNRPTAEQFARSIRSALDQGRPADAHRLAEQALVIYPRAGVVRAAAGEVELDGGRIPEAVEHLQQVTDDGSSLYRDVAATLGDLLFQMNRLGEAERYFRRVLELNPNNLPGQRRLALVFALSGRRTAAQNAFFQIIRGPEFDTHDLALCGEPDQVFNNPELVKRFDGPAPSDWAALLGAARYALHKKRPTAAAALYRSALVDQPSDLDALAGLGRALLDIGDADEFLRWHSELPVAADSVAEIWDLRGRFALLRSEIPTAIRCFGEAVRLDPNQSAPNFQLGALLIQSGQVDSAGKFRRRAERLRELREVLEIVLAENERVDFMLKAADLTEKLGRIREARGWLLAAATHAESRQLYDRAERLAESLAADDVDLTVASENPAGQLEFSHLPLPTWRANKPASGQSSSKKATRNAARVEFSDMAAQAGVDFTYFNGHDPDVQGFRIFETSGAGVAALDFDGDLWPDLYFTQGGNWPPREGQTQYLDRLFRNLGDGRFSDATLASGLGDDRYSQGVSAGDIDGDGFPDLYVANIGQNRLYRNNGDGTFTDGTAAAGLVGGGWTTSALLADLNGDGLPDIYDVTYLAGRLPFEHVCHGQVKKNIVRVCAPSVFEAEPDRLFLNRGDGTFEDISLESGIAVPDGKGLGIVAFDHDGSGRLSLYVANDTTPNFLLTNQTVQPGDRPTFSDQAKLLGCAVNGEGTAPASMGIAIDDSDGDGLLDLFITAFYNEPFVLFRQQPGGFFVDVTAPAGLKEPTVPMLGFGTQFLDGELDGLPDLVMANGHVDDFRDIGIPYRMRAQYFTNLGAGRFAELPPEQAGDYFRIEQLGRGMARLDWNRDGREDFAVSNLDTPASLVTNQTQGAGHFLSLQLRGVQSSRDAIGTTVVLHVGERRVVRQLTAGDGYDASNQRQLVFGLGADEIAEELHVRWPAGQEQTFAHIPADSEYLLIEGRPILIRLPPP
jgi:tetratricopeptide (TPR) repeat protein